MVFCLFAAVYANVWLKENLETLPYLEISKNGTDNSFAINFFVKWGNWVLIFTNFVPISLLVTLEMVKFFQGIAITFDQGTISGTGISATV
jgi:phospholipid-transporting ATPase